MEKRKAKAISPEEISKYEKEIGAIEKRIVRIKAKLKAAKVKANS
jgi:hypothetical protein